jgi:hypothetical protein
MRNKQFPEADVSPYLQLENIDPQWLKAIGYERPAGEVQKVRDQKAKPEVNRTGDDAGLAHGDGNTLT